MQKFSIDLKSIDIKKYQKQFVVLAVLLAALAVFIYFNFLLRPQIARVFTARD